MFLAQGMSQKAPLFLQLLLFLPGRLFLRYLKNLFRFFIGFQTIRLWLFKSVYKRKTVCTEHRYVTLNCDENILFHLTK